MLLAELLDDLGAYLADRAGDGVRSLADVILYEDEHAEIEQRYFGHELFLEAVETGGRAGPGVRRGSPAKPGLGARYVVSSRASRELTSSSRPPTGRPGRAT